ncbi:MAG: hypothetical protein R2857_05965 [Vampirovibrionales bacterium]
MVNDVSRSDIGMGSDHNEVTLYLPNHEAILVPKTSKSLIARQLLLRLAQHVKAQQTARHHALIHTSGGLTDTQWRYGHDAAQPSRVQKCRDQ